MSSSSILTVFCSILVLASMPDETGFISLFDGKTLKGWRKHMGLPADNIGGKWEVIEDAIVGDQDPPGKGGFLITQETYSNFILKLETQIDWPVDSGIFLRVGEDGKSHQVTLDHRPEGDIGGIYLPWTQGYVRRSAQGIQYWKTGAWNDVKIQIEGEPARIRFWLNGHLVTDFQHTEETTRGVPRAGYIALQIHPGENWIPGNKARFRKIRIKPGHENSTGFKDRQSPTPHLPSAGASERLESPDNPC